MPVKSTQTATLLTRKNKIMEIQRRSSSVFQKSVAKRDSMFGTFLGMSVYEPSCRSSRGRRRRPRDGREPFPAVTGESSVSATRRGIVAFRSGKTSVPSQPCMNSRVGVSMGESIRGRKWSPWMVSDMTSAIHVQQLGLGEVLRWMRNEENPPVQPETSGALGWS